MVTCTGTVNGGHDYVTDANLSPLGLQYCSRCIGTNGNGHKFKGLGNPLVPNLDFCELCGVVVKPV